MEANDRGSKRENVARPDFRQLETFIKVAETRSFVDAARQLGVSQPAISQTIARLEDVYGGDLFVRKRGTPVALTLMGRAILPKVKLLLFMIDSQIQRAAAIAQSMTGCLTVGFSSGLARGPLRAGIDEFREALPDVDLRFIEAAPGELYRQPVITMMITPITLATGPCTESTIDCSGVSHGMPVPPAQAGEEVRIAAATRLAR